jgi:hypothetical protein
MSASESEDTTGFLVFSVLFVFWISERLNRGDGIVMLSIPWKNVKEEFR